MLHLKGGNWRSDVNYLLQALEEMTKYIKQHPEQTGQCPIAVGDNLLSVIPEIVLMPREAFLAPSLSLPLQEAISRVCAEVVACSCSIYAGYLPR